jgi:hypothetical protein
MFFIMLFCYPILLEMGRSIHLQERILICFKALAQMAFVNNQKHRRSTFSISCRKVHNTDR